MVSVNARDNTDMIKGWKENASVWELIFTQKLPSESQLIKLFKTWQEFREITPILARDPDYNFSAKVINGPKALDPNGKFLQEAEGVATKLKNFFFEDESSKKDKNSKKSFKDLPSNYKDLINALKKQHASFVAKNPKPQASQSSLSFEIFLKDFIQRLDSSVKRLDSNALQISNDKEQEHKQELLNANKLVEEQRKNQEEEQQRKKREEEQKIKAEIAKRNLETKAFAEQLRLKNAAELQIQNDDFFKQMESALDILSKEKSRIAKNKPNDERVLLIDETKNATTNKLNTLKNDYITYYSNFPNSIKLQEKKLSEIENAYKEEAQKIIQEKFLHNENPKINSLWAQKVGKATLNAIILVSGILTLGGAFAISYKLHNNKYVFFPINTRTEKAVKKSLAAVKSVKTSNKK